MNDLVSFVAPFTFDVGGVDLLRCRISGDGFEGAGKVTFSFKG